MGVESGAVDHGALADIHHRDFTQRTLLQQGEQGVGEELPGYGAAADLPGAGWFVSMGSAPYSGMGRSVAQTKTNVKINNICRLSETHGTFSVEDYRDTNGTELCERAGNERQPPSLYNFIGAQSRFRAKQVNRSRITH